MEVLGTSADDLGSMRDNDEQAFDAVFQQANFKEYVFRVRAKVDTFNVRRISKLAYFIQTIKCFCLIQAKILPIPP